MSSIRSFVERVWRSGTLLLIARILVGGWFVYLATMKLSDPIDFLKQIHEYHLVPDTMPIALNVIAIVLPLLELICGLAVLTVWLCGARHHHRGHAARILPAPADTSL